MLALLLTSLAALAHPSDMYYSPTSQEGLLTFSATVQTSSETQPTEDEMRAVIGKQYFYMLGNLRWGVEGMPATPSKTFELSHLSAALTGDETWTISYSAKTNIAIDKAFKGGDLKFDVPRDPAFMATLDQACNNDPSEPNWYGFNPHKEGCELATTDFSMITGQVDLHPNTLESYPEYSKLMSADGFMHMSVFMNYEITHEEPFIKKMTDAGFTRHAWTEDEITTYLGDAPIEMPKVDDFTKGRVKVLLFYGNANIDSRKSAAFHHFYKDALENANVVVYSGHSGLSRNVDLSLIEQRENFKITLKPTYQLYFLAGCITYGYYVDGYLARKATADDPRGTRNLDVITFGTASPGYDDKPLFALSDALFAWGDSGATATYQSITDKITYSWFGVVGDEDNPKPVAP